MRFGAKTFQAAPGHRNIKSTMRYVAANVETVRAAVAKVGAVLGKGTR